MGSTSNLDNILTATERESMTITTVDPAELIVDWTVNEAHVQEIIDSLPAHGNRIVFPPYISLHNRKIIDGLHRVVAAERSGMRELQVVLVDVPETRFWDLRIMAAKPHHTIGNERLYEWMESCWKADWGGSDDAQRAVAENLWQIFRVENHRQTGSIHTAPSRSKLNGEQAELYDWFVAKSKAWGIPVTSLADRILLLWNSYAPAKRQESQPSKEQRPPMPKAAPVPLPPKIEEIAADYGLTLTERDRLHSEVKANPSIKPAYIEKWVNAEMPGTLLNHAKQEKQQKVDRKKARIVQREASPNGQQQEQRRRFATVRDAVNRAGDEIRRVSPLLPSVPESASLLANLFQMIQQHTDNLVNMEEDAIRNTLAENARLYKENAELKIRVASLERSLGKPSVISSDVIAMSSIEIR